jgi:hypothetical protein
MRVTERSNNDRNNVGGNLPDENIVICEVVTYDL